MKDFVSKDAAMAAVRKLHIGLDGDGEAALHVKRSLSAAVKSRVYFGLIGFMVLSEVGSAAS